MRLSSMVVILMVMLTAISATSQPVFAWERGVWTPCSKCHPTDPKPIPVEAEETLQAMACLNCHSPRFPPAMPDASYAHYAHSAVFGFGAGPGDPTRHPRAAEAEKMGKDVGDCIDCHFQVRDGDCMLCHANEMPHVGDRVDCDYCHGSTPNVESHVIELRLHDGLGEPACPACHDAENRDYFRLASGSLIEYANPLDLCYQCHYEYYRDWEEGKHPALVRAVCTEADCHDPHDPHMVAEIPEIEGPPSPPLIRGEIAMMVIGAVIVVAVVILYVRERRLMAKEARRGAE